MSFKLSLSLYFNCTLNCLAIECFFFFLMPLGYNKTCYITFFPLNILTRVDLTNCSKLFASSSPWSRIDRPIMFQVSNNMLIFCLMKLKSHTPLLRSSIPASHPAAAPLSPFSIQATVFSAWKIWYQHRLPPVSLGEAELTGFLMERWGRAEALLMCLPRASAATTALFSHSAPVGLFWSYFLAHEAPKIIVSPVSGNGTH